MWQLLKWTSKNLVNQLRQPTKDNRKNTSWLFWTTFFNQAKTHHNNTNNWPCNFRSNTTTLTFSPSPRIMLRFTFCTGNPLMTSTTTSRLTTGTLHVNTLVDRLGSIFVRTIAFFDSWGCFWNASIIPHQTFQSAAQRAKKAPHHMDDTSSTHLQCSLLCTHKHQADWHPIIGLSSPPSMECKKFELTSSDRIQPHMVGIQYSLADLLKILCHKVHRQWRELCAWL